VTFDILTAADNVNQRPSGLSAVQFWAGRQSEFLHQQNCLFETVAWQRAGPPQQQMPTVALATK